MSSILLPERGPGQTIRGSTVTSNEFDAFLSEVLPPFGLCPSAYRRRNIRRRIVRRMESTEIHEFPRYRDLVLRDPSEREALRSLLVVTISRFFRNARVFQVLSREVLPRLATKGTPAAIWSAGCAAGEEPYSLRIAWEELPGEKPPIRLLATDIDAVSLERAAAGRYPQSSLREVPDALRRRYFNRESDSYCVREEVRHSVLFRRMDLLRDGSPGRFGLILCRNAAFTYFCPDQRLLVAGMLAASLEKGGYLVLGRTETLPEKTADLFEPAFPAERIYRVRAGALRSTQQGG
jgi:chemotaxis protein methyltransferase CheR